RPSLSFFFQAEDGIRDFHVTGVQTCALPILASGSADVAEINISGSGKLRGADFSTRVARVRITGSGDVEIAASEEIDAQITGSGTVLYKGDPARVNSHSTGSGKVRKL